LHGSEFELDALAPALPPSVVPKATLINNQTPRQRSRIRRCLVRPSCPQASTIARDVIGPFHSATARYGNFATRARDQAAADASRGGDSSTGYRQQAAATTRGGSPAGTGRGQPAATTTRRGSPAVTRGGSPPASASRGGSPAASASRGGSSAAPASCRGSPAASASCRCKKVVSGCKRPASSTNCWCP